MTAQAGPALLVIDLQKAIDDPRWSVDGPRNNPAAEANVGRLLEAWRRDGRMVVHVRHDSTEPNSTYRPDGPGHAFKPETAPWPGEPVIAKRVHSAFVGTELQGVLSEAGVSDLIVAGVITNNSVEATVRHASNLGFAVQLVEDACFTFAKKDRRGRLWTAEDVHALSLANLEGEYCQIVRTEEAVGRLLR